MVEMRKSLRWTVSTCAVGVLLTAAACTSGGEGSADSDSESGDSGETTEVAAESFEIRGWEGVCDVFDPDSVLNEFGGEYLEGGPSEVGLDAGMFVDALSCNALFVPESDPDQDQSAMYLNLAPSDNAERATERFEELWQEDYDFHNQEDPNTQAMLATEEDMEGDWDQAAMFVSVGNHGDRVWAYYLKGSYFVQIQLTWGPDKEVHYAELDGEEDLSEFAELDFTPLDIASWVKNTYLPQVYEAIEAKIAEGIGE